MHWYCGKSTGRRGNGSAREEIRSTAVFCVCVREVARLTCQTCSTHENRRTGGASWGSERGAATVTETDQKTWMATSTSSVLSVTYAHPESCEAQNLPIL